MNYRNRAGEGFEPEVADRDYVSNLLSEDFDSEAFMFENDSFDFSEISWNELKEIFPDVKETKKDEEKGRNPIAYKYKLWNQYSDQDTLNKLMYNESVSNDKELVDTVLDFVNSYSETPIIKFHDKSGNVVYKEGNPNIFNEENTKKVIEYSTEEAKGNINPDIWFREIFQNRDENNHFTKGKYFRYTNILSGESFNTTNNFEAFTLEGTYNTSYSIDEMRKVYSVWNEAHSSQ